MESANGSVATGRRNGLTAKIAATTMALTKWPSHGRFHDRMMHYRPASSQHAVEEVFSETQHARAFRPQTWNVGAMLISVRSSSAKATDFIERASRRPSSR